MKMKIFVAFITVLLFSNCTNDNVNTDTEVTLTQNEINDLKFLREEEKLARDVYIYSYNKYKLAIFNSISQSEQTHMNSVLSLLNKYGIPDPSSVQMGIFVNQDLQVLYNNLISQSNISLIEALKVGATIEDLDINDIDDFIINTSKSDLLTVYNNLTCGSKNHIRSFTTELSNNEVSYEPQFISLEEYNSIINTPSGGCGNN
ncbi:DUF2202 domain-containing protein [Flavobacterium petrolei]|uniref:DUF2202 domain-containing protein n=1 Tax=Flavobacterium petrolei TaxID=2259594 RepID=A0A482TF24_9FLAO|nr:DUF2202 domain-containing protein [Flavobacterium petrolei]MDD2820004.1 DUF2202 domain-containing protein [Flavobacterium sp.]RYJ51295.1 DUF2202 domain-containing protein [Flavobacterium petrolei]